MKSNGFSMIQILIMVVVVILVVVGIYLYSQKGVTQLSTPSPVTTITPTTPQALEKELDSVDLGDIDQDFTAIDRDLQALQ